MNVPLKLAIWQSEWRTQLALAKAIGMHESRLSHIIQEHDPATAAEKTLIAKCLKKKESDLWVPEPTASGRAAGRRPSSRVREAIAS